MGPRAESDECPHWTSKLCRNSDGGQQGSSESPGSASHRVCSSSLHLSLINRGHLVLPRGPDGKGTVGPKVTE